MVRVCRGVVGSTSIRVAEGVFGPSILPLTLGVFGDDITASAGELGRGGGVLGPSGITKGWGPPGGVLAREPMTKSRTSRERGGVDGWAKGASSRCSSCPDSLSAPSPEICDDSEASVDTDLGVPLSSWPVQ
jgi:hypothetical protein